MAGQWIKWSAAVVVAAGAAAWSPVTRADDRVLNVGGVADAAGGTIKGVVKFEGEQRPRKPIVLPSTDPFCQQSHADAPPLEEKWVFGAGDTLQNVVVFVSKGVEGVSFEVPGEPARLNQHGCIYVPHVQAMVAGQQLVIHNDDNTAHNVRMSSASNGRLNIAQNVKGMEEKMTLARPESGIQFQCDVHPWMGAYVNVLPHPFFAVTQGDGTFTIQGLPAGEYELGTWHEFSRFGPKEETTKVTVTAGQTSEVTITYHVKPSK